MLAVHSTPVGNMLRELHYLAGAANLVMRVLQGACPLCAFPYACIAATRMLMLQASVGSVTKAETDACQSLSVPQAWEMEVHR